MAEDGEHPREGSHVLSGPLSPPSAEDRPLAERLDSALHENALVYQQLTLVQERCTELLELLRTATRSSDILADVVAERVRQDQKWGVPGDPKAPQDAMLIPNGTGGSKQKDNARLAKALCDASTEQGILTFCDILTEETCEVFAESDPVLLRKELVEVAAVAVKWITVLDKRALWAKERETQP